MIIIPKKRDYTTDIKLKLIEKGYKIISNDDEYINMATDLVFKCHNCSAEYKRTPKMALKSNPMCIKCIQKNITGQKLNLQKLDVKAIAEFMNKNEVDYQIDNGYILINCKKCNKSIKRRWYVMKSAKNPFHCELCAKGSSSVYTLSKDIINQKLKDLKSETICIENDIFGWKSIIPFRCECGNIFQRKPNTVISMKMWRCNECSNKISKGEQRVMNYLIKNNIKFEYQKKFEDCKYIKNLIFDFYLSEMNTVIEYDGEFHYRDIYGELELQNTRDMIKDEYCYKNKINIIRIPFYKFNEIEEILDKYIYGNIVPSQLEMTERCND